MDIFRADVAALMDGGDIDISVSKDMEELDMTKDELLSVAGTGDKPSAWAAEAAAWAKEIGLMNGDGAGNYGWQQPVTREAVAVMMKELWDKMGKSK
jgi:hypothetical protein